MIVVAIIGLLLAITIPNYVRARANSQATTCINNLRQLSGAVSQYALENHIASGASVTLNNLLPYLKLTSAGSLPPCPASGTYSVTTTTNDATCSLGSTVTPPHVLN